MKNFHASTGNPAKDRWLKLFSILRSVTMAYEVYPTADRLEKRERARKRMVEFCGCWDFQRPVLDSLYFTNGRKKLKTYFYWKNRMEEAAKKKAELIARGEYVDW